MYENTKFLWLFYGFMNGMEKRNFTNYARNGGKTAEMRNNSAKSGMVGMSVVVSTSSKPDRHKADGRTSLSCN